MKRETMKIPCDHEIKVDVGDRLLITAPYGDWTGTCGGYRRSENTIWIKVFPDDQRDVKDEPLYYGGRIDIEISRVSLILPELASAELARLRAELAAVTGERDALAEALKYFTETPFHDVRKVSGEDCADIMVSVARIHKIRRLVTAYDERRRLVTDVMQNPEVSE